MTEHLTVLHQKVGPSVLLFRDRAYVEVFNYSPSEDSPPYAADATVFFPGDRKDSYYLGPIRGWPGMDEITVETEDHSLRSYFR